MTIIKNEKDLSKLTRQDVLLVYTTEISTDISVHYDLRTQYYYNLFYFPSLYLSFFI